MKEAELSAADSQTTKSCWQLLRSQPWASAQGAQHLICQVLGTHHFPVSSEVRIPRNMSCVLSVLLPQHGGCITQAPDRETTNHPGPCREGSKGEEARFMSLNKAKQAGLVFCTSTRKTAGYIWCICYLSPNQQPKTALPTSTDTQQWLRCFLLLRISIWHHLPENMEHLSKPRALQ